MWGMVMLTRRTVRILMACGVVALGSAVSPAAGQTAAEATFARDVLPILQRSCQRCHRPGTAAPMSLLTYEDTRPWARAIKDRVIQRQMPPWHLDRSIGEYANDPSLTDAEIATIAAWVDAGAPEGDPTDAPPPIDLAALGEWAFGEPDLVVQMKEGFLIPVEGDDFYPSEVVDSGLTEDRYVKWVQILPEAYCCVHHSHVYVSSPEGPAAEGVGLGMGSNSDVEIDLIEYGMGNTGDYYPDGTGKLLKAGSRFRFTTHYHPWGQEIRDRQKVGIKFYPKGQDPELLVTSHRNRTGVGHDWALNRELLEAYLIDGGYDLELAAAEMPTGALVSDNIVGRLGFLSIPPHSVARHERYFPLAQAAMVINFQPHMHFRGKRMLLEAIHVDGRREVLTDVTNYEQTWQLTYTYDDPHLFPRGTILHIVSWHDNTAANRHNPDPSAWIGYGPRTMDEMSHGWTDIAYLSDQQYDDLVEARRD